MQVPAETTALLLRVWKRRCSLEEEPSEILSAEFELGDGSPDLRPSVYEIDPSEVVQVVTQHYAAADCGSVTAPRDHPDLRPIHAGDVDATPSASHWFRFLDERHRELVLSSKQELMTLIARLRECQTHRVTPQDWKTYLRSARNEPDWQNFFQFAARGPKWKKLAGG